MSKQLTSLSACKHKHSYVSKETARRAAKRRNKAAGYKYLRSYECNNCHLWHVTSEKLVDNEATA